MHSNKMMLWTVYDRPADFPLSYVVRRFEIGASGKISPTNCIFVSNDLDSCRRYVQLSAEQYSQGAPICFARTPEDEPCIVESWL